jgi:hypothetical protein
VIFRAKLAVLLLLIGAIVGQFEETTSHAASVSKCAKVGLRSKVNGNSMTCSSVGGKLQWLPVPGSRCRTSGSLSGSARRPLICTKVSGKLVWTRWLNQAVLETTTTSIASNNRETTNTVSPITIPPFTRITAPLPTVPPSTTTTTTTIAIRTCSNTGPCAIGDTGPGGGIVFFVSDSPRSGGRILEVNRSGDTFYNWSNAMSAASSYSGGGFTDWRLPSKEELDLLYRSAVLNPFDCSSCWSSTGASTNAWAQDFVSGNQFLHPIWTGERIRLIRGFG